MILLLALMLSPACAHASENPELTRYFSERIARMQSSMSKLDKGQDTMKLEKVTIGLVPQVTFGLTGVLNLTVAPEIDFVLTPEEGDQGK